MPMQPVELYTSPLCGFCHAAKRLLKQKGAQFTEVDFAADQPEGQIVSARITGRNETRLKA